MMTMRGKLLLVLALAATSLAVVFSPGYSQECTSVPGTNYNVPSIDRNLAAAQGLLAGCSGANRNCREADKRLEAADVAIIQILTECTNTGNCRKGEIDVISDRASRLANLSGQLIRQSGMRRTYDNTLVTVNSWRSTPRCPQARCQQYARTAVAQNQENIKRRCGFTGTRWTNDYKGHHDWCFTAPQNLADSETRIRADELKRCTAQPDNVQRCQQYARTAVAQYRENISKKCGYTGNRWTDNYNGHYGWCIAVQQGVADSETQARTNELRQCAARPKTVSCPGPGMTVVHKLVESMPYTGYSVICRDGSGRLWFQGANAAPISSISRGKWNSQTGCYDGTKVVVPSRTIAGKLCKP